MEENPKDSDAAEEKQPTENIAAERTKKRFSMSRFLVNRRFIIFAIMMALTVLSAVGIFFR